MPISVHLSVKTYPYRFTECLRFLSPILNITIIFSINDITKDRDLSVCARMDVNIWNRGRGIGAMIINTYSFCKRKFINDPAIYLNTTYLPLNNIFIVYDTLLAMPGISSVFSPIRNKCANL